VIVGASLLSEGFLVVGGSEGVIRVFQLHTPWASA